MALPMGGNGRMLSRAEPDPYPGRPSFRRSEVSDPSRPKPLPARLAPGDPRPAPTPPAEATHAQDEPEVTVSGRGDTWRVTVLGRSGRAEARSAPLMLLGFSPARPGAASLEALAAGRSLLDLPQEALESALMRALEPAAGDRRRPFFEDADGARGS